MPVPASALQPRVTLHAHSWHQSRASVPVARRHHGNASKQQVRDSNLAYTRAVKRINVYKRATAIAATDLPTDKRLVL